MCRVVFTVPPCRYGIPVLPAFNISVPLYDNHANIPMANGKLDCMHYCHPGVPQVGRCCCCMYTHVAHTEQQQKCHKPVIVSAA